MKIQRLAMESRKPLKIPQPLENGSFIRYPSPLEPALTRGNPHAHDYQATDQMVGTRDFGIFTASQSAPA
jgi:hypothetical protein